MIGNTGIMTRVETASGASYLIDPAAGTLTRVASPGAWAGVDPDYDWVQLRRDGEPMELVGIVLLEVGEGAVFVVDLHIEGVVSTTRTTTPVIGIYEV